MANENNPVINIWRGRQKWQYHYSVLIGSFLDRIEKAHGKIEIDDPDLAEKLTPEQLKTLSANFPHLDPDKPLPIAPPIENVPFRIPVDALGEVETYIEASPIVIKDMDGIPISDAKAIFTIIDDVRYDVEQVAATSDTVAHGKLINPQPQAAKRGGKPNQKA